MQVKEEKKEPLVVVADIPLPQTAVTRAPPQIRKGFVSSSVKKPAKSTRHQASQQAKQQGMPQNGLIGISKMSLELKKKPEALNQVLMNQVASAELSVIQSLGTREHNTAEVLQHNPTTAESQTDPSQDEQMKPLMQLDSQGTSNEPSISADRNSNQAQELIMIRQTVDEQRRKSFLDPLPIFQGGIRGSEPSIQQVIHESSLRKSYVRMVTSQTKQHKLTESSKSELPDRDIVTPLSKNRSHSDLSKATQMQCWSATEISQRDCKHLKVSKKTGLCANCGGTVQQYGSIFDTGTIKSFIKVLFVDESKKAPIAPLNRQQEQKQVEQLHEPALGDTISTTAQPKDNEYPRYAPKEQVYRDVRPTIAVQYGNPYVMTKVIYESYAPENTHQMREYILNVTLRNVKRMLKHGLMTPAAYERFKLTDVTIPDSPLAKFRSRQKRLNKVLEPEYLQFDSVIESGNLERVEAFPLNHKLVEMARASRQTVLQKYNLYCKVDTNTKGHQQWFYFRVKNTKKQTKYQFSICNFTKPFSLFKQGMQVQLLSKREQKKYVQSLEAKIAQHQTQQTELEEQPALDADARLLMEEGLVKEQWQPAGANIQYVKSVNERTGWDIPGPLNTDDKEDQNIGQDDLEPPTLGEGDEFEQQQQTENWRKRYFYQLNFELEFLYEDDTVYIAYSRPYPYSQILAHMFETELRLEKVKDAGHGKTVKKEKERDFRLKLIKPSFKYERKLMCSTISGLPVPVISITAKKSAMSMHKRQVIFVTARVHPGETNASTVFEGFLDKLTEQVESSPILANFIVKLVPCMNPDGVVCGNYRSSLAGVDLNRQWILPHEDLHPEVFHTKALMHQITKVDLRKILIYCDIHCHSRKKNSFLYGCNTAAEGAPFSSWTQVRLLPRLFARRSQFVSLPSCQFGIDACKLGTARVVVWKEFQVMNSFTLENSFFGYNYGPETRVYTQDCYRQVGGSLYLSFNDYRVCTAQIEKEMIDLKGWLKPMKLKEITGVPAAELIAREMKQERILAKKADYIRKYQARLAKERVGFTIPPLQTVESKVYPFSRKQTLDKLKTDEKAITQPQEAVADTVEEIPTQAPDEQPPTPGQDKQQEPEAKKTDQPEEDLKEATLSNKLQQVYEVASEPGDQEGGTSAKSFDKAGEGGAEPKSLTSRTRQDECINEPIDEPIEVPPVPIHAKKVRVQKESKSVMEKSDSRATQKVIQDVAEKVIELTGGALNIDNRNIVPKNAASSLRMAKQDSLRFTYEAATPPLSRMLTVNGKNAIGNASSKNGSTRTGRDSCQTLLAESERQRRSNLQKKLVISQETMMRGKFGDPTESPSHIQPNRSSSGVVSPDKEYYDVKEILQLGEDAEDEFLDEHGEYLYPSVNVGTAEHDWRQLFDEEELHHAYQQSIIGFKDVKVEVNKSKKDKTTIAQRIARDGTFYNEDDDSGDDDSVDDLNEDQLLRQVYLQKESTIQQAMRTTAFAQSNFLHEVKVMIKKIHKSQQIPATTESPPPPQQIINQDPIPLSLLAANAKHNEIAKKKYNQKRMPLQLTGVQIERHQKQQEPRHRVVRKSSNTPINDTLMKGKVMRRPTFQNQHYLTNSTVESNDEVFVESRQAVKSTRGASKHKLTMMMTGALDHNDYMLQLDTNSVTKTIFTTKADPDQQHNYQLVSEIAAPHDIVVASRSSDHARTDSSRPIDTGMRQIYMGDHKEHILLQAVDSPPSTSRKITNPQPTKDGKKFQLQIMTTEQETIGMNIEHIHLKPSPTRRTIEQNSSLIRSIPYKDQLSESRTLRNNTTVIKTQQQPENFTVNLREFVLRTPGNDQDVGHQTNYAQKRQTVRNADVSYGKVLRGNRLTNAVMTGKTQLGPIIESNNNHQWRQLGNTRGQLAIDSLGSQRKKLCPAIGSQRNPNFGARTTLHSLNSVIVEESYTAYPSPSARNKESTIRVMVKKRTRQQETSSRQSRMEDTSSSMKKARQQITSLEARPRESEDKIMDAGDTILSHRFSGDGSDGQLAIAQKAMWPSKKVTRGANASTIIKRSPNVASKLRNTVTKKRTTKLDVQSRPKKEKNSIMGTLPKLQGSAEQLGTQTQTLRGRNNEKNRVDEQEKGVHYSTVQLQSVERSVEVVKVMQAQVLASEHQPPMIEYLAEEYAPNSQQSSMPDTPLGPVRANHESIQQTQMIQQEKIQDYDLATLSIKNDSSLEVTEKRHQTSGLKRTVMSIEPRAELNTAIKKTDRVTDLGNMNIYINKSTNPVSLRSQRASSGRAQTAGEEGSNMLLSSSSRQDTRQEYQLDSQVHGGGCYGGESSQKAGEKSSKAQAKLLPIQPGSILFRQLVDEQRSIQESLTEDQGFMPLSAHGHASKSSSNDQISKLLVASSGCLIHGDQSQTRRQGIDDFQKYLTMNIQNMKNEQIRKTYADQLEKSQQSQNRSISRDPSIGSSSATQLVAFDSARMPNTESKKQLAEVLYNAIQDQSSTHVARRGHDKTNQFRANPVPGNGSVRPYMSPVSRQAHDLIYSQAANQKKGLSKISPRVSNVVNHANDYLDSNHQLGGADSVIMSRSSHNGSKQQIEQPIGNFSHYGLEAANNAAKAAQIVNESASSYQPSPFISQHVITTPRGRYIASSAKERKGGLPTIAQSIDNAKFASTNEPIEEVRSSTKHSVSRGTEYSMSEAGFFDDQKSLANINIIQIANGAISPSSSVAKTKHLKSRFAIESLQQSLKGRPPDLMKNQKGQRLNLKSILANEIPAQVATSQLANPMRNSAQQMQYSHPHYPQAVIQRSTQDLRKNHATQHSHEHLPFLQTFDSSLRAGPFMPAVHPNSPRYRQSQAQSLMTQPQEQHGFNSSRKQLSSVASMQQMLMTGKTVKDRPVRDVRASPDQFRLNHPKTNIKKGLKR